MKFYIYLLLGLHIAILAPCISNHSLAFNSTFFLSDSIRSNGILPSLLYFFHFTPLLLPPNIDISGDGVGKLLNATEPQQLLMPLQT